MHAVQSMNQRNAEGITLSAIEVQKSSTNTKMVLGMVLCGEVLGAIMYLGLLQEHGLPLLGILQNVIGIWILVMIFLDVMGIFAVLFLNGRRLVVTAIAHCIGACACFIILGCKLDMPPHVITLVADRRIIVADPWVRYMMLCLPVLHMGIAFALVRISKAINEIARNDPDVVFTTCCFASRIQIGSSSKKWSFVK